MRKKVIQEQVAIMNSLLARIRQKKASVGIIGLGYVGLPLVLEFCKAGFSVTGFDTDRKKVEILKQGKSYIKHIKSSFIKNCASLFTPTSDFSKLSATDCIILCVPTPLNKNREPDMTYVFSTTETVARYLRRGQLVILESTTYPGTTDEDVRKILEETGLKTGKDFYLAYSPEREDPNNKNYTTATIPKVIGGYTEKCLSVTKALYDSIIVKTVPVSSTKVAEATKLLENIYRAVNIALVNEMKMLFDRMDIDIWEVIEASKTKPFGFQAFYPGPGLGGHCIPIDPFYLTWKAREYDFRTRFIELAGEINTSMPYYVVQKVEWVLNKFKKPLQGSRILILGMAYKKDVDDKRESPALRVIHLLKENGAKVNYNDPHVPLCKNLHSYPDMNMKSVALTKNVLKKADLILLLTDHTAYDYPFIEKHARCIVDTRNAFARNGIRLKKIFKA
jgi:UDP-N-acetyl-D-glucosamine dehydrogenase